MFKLLSRINAMERNGQKVIHLEIGDPYFDTPAHVIQATKEALDQGKTHYVDSMGIQELREAVCDFTKKSLGFRPDLSQVLIAPANAVIDFLIQCVANPGDEIVVPSPGFPTYASVISYTGMKPVAVPLEERNGFRMNPEDVRRSITKRTKLIIINSPQNPTGAVMNEEEISQIAQIAEENRVFLLSDEIYSRIIYDKAHYSPSGRDQCKETTIVLNGFSKAYSMTGWRLGYAIGPERVIEKMGLLLQTILSCLPPFIQYGGISALTGDQEIVSERVKELRICRDLIVRGLNNVPGFSCLTPDGAFYAFANITKTGLTSAEVAQVLLEKAGVAVLPGDCFGKYGEGYIRACYATPVEAIEEAIGRIKEIGRGG